VRVLFCGDRNWTSKEPIRKQMRKVKLANPNTVVVHGAARGADTLAADVATEFELGVEAYPAQWDRFGRGAGPIRNQQMLDSGVDLVIAFHPNIEASKGTKDMVKRARKAKIPVILVEGE
jgi:YspA, cpYpsA-related SLOG family